MLRKALSLLIVLLFAGFEPVMAGIAFCAQSSCCATSSPAAATLDLPGCCVTISCYDGPSTDVAVKAEAKTFASPTVVEVRTALITPRLSAPRIAVQDTSPPPTMSERLSSLSLFLI